MSLVLFLHIFSIGIWLGCVLVEAIIEWGPWSRETAPQIHYAIDRWVEIPAFSTVLITGLFMVDMSRLSGWYAIKIIFGLIAVGINIYCAIPVVRRKYAADSGNKAQVQHYSRQIYWTFIIGLPAGLIALGIGLSMITSTTR